jgi:hypothetical protein
MHHACHAENSGLLIEWFGGAIAATCGLRESVESCNGVFFLVALADILACLHEISL